MHEPQRMVEEFHRATGATIGVAPAIRDARLRAELIEEEAGEFRAALGCLIHEDHGVLVEDSECDKRPDLIAAIDALCDLLYVVYGTAVTFGIDIEPFFAEVHRSNMTKIGGPVREDGKRLKPDTYEPPSLGPILKRQRLLAATMNACYEKWNCGNRVHECVLLAGHEDYGEPHEWACDSVGESS